MKHRILCVYSNIDEDEELEYLPRGPKVELEGHDVTVVRTLIEARCMLEFCDGFFEYVLADKDVLVDEDAGDYRVSASLILDYEGGPIKCLGMFVPADENTVYVELLKDGSVMVADKTCWTFTGERDWKMLLNLVKRITSEFTRVKINDD